MKTLLCTCIATVMLLSPLPATASEYSAKTGLTYQSWSSNKDESGSQLYIPLQMEAVQDRFSWFVKTGYASTDGDLDGESKQSIDGMLDSQAGVTYSLPHWAGFDWLVGLDVNLPSGRTGQDERKIRIMIDPDLVDIVSPGQGLNINPTISVARQWGKLMAGLGLGYAFQGEYDYSDQTGSYDPGDMLNVAGQVNYAFSQAWGLNLQAQYVTIGVDRVEGNDLLDKGDIWLLGAALKRSGTAWEVSLSIQDIVRGKAKVKDSSGSLVTEPKDSQGAEMVVALSGRYELNARTAVFADLQYLHVAENGYTSTSSFYMGSRQKVALLMGMQRQLQDALELQLALSGFTMDDDPNWLHPGEDRRYQGWSLTAAVVKQF